ncbi:hypothetical protein J056_001727 [Wallemia ichthyophaga EXF-994]|uniref:Uncharacterized protein n=1 Tax=Wallemia ichthyophaga (strain EXF-994 / CBS 113033) TaxID=1299270 RepID=R9ABG7_WALI9|nr:uncharacterized protein J056_001727 [Wallemia ichthyophaga EXF-994]EOQ99404.1 hypothetical protein J056_001727 [Wallemia ichthyophaga EXF-994]TIB56911.1 hypothetical protein E3P78_04186 [Wallemia ichthyophaga]
MSVKMMDCINTARSLDEEKEFSFASSYTLFHQVIQEIMAVSVASDYTVSPTEDVKDMLFAYDVAYFASMLTDSV